ncbi:Calcineurin B-like protein 4 [Linum grandiflorum]
MLAFRGCFFKPKIKKQARYDANALLASETPFTINEIEALYNLFQKLSSSVRNDDLIHKEQFLFALVRSRKTSNLFAERVFNLFDIKHNGVIEFDEFVRSLSVFHPRALLADKISFAFRFYDLRDTGYIERDETLAEADLNGDGKIDKQEWKELVAKHPSLIRNMTIPYLSEDQVEALFELFRKLSSSLLDDGLISKEEFQLGLFGNSRKQTLLANRLFQLFDAKRDGAIDFHEFVTALSVFHPKAAQAEKVTFSFQLYDISETGFIQRKEVKELVLALLDESDMILTDDMVEAIVDKVCLHPKILQSSIVIPADNTITEEILHLCLQTFNDADSKGDGKIDQDEWKEFTTRNPSLLHSLTLPYLLDVGRMCPSFATVPDIDDDTSRSSFTKMRKV